MSLGYKFIVDITKNIKIKIIIIYLELFLLNFDILSILNDENIQRIGTANTKCFSNKDVPDKKIKGISDIRGDSRKRSSL